MQLKVRGGCVDLDEHEGIPREKLAQLSYISDGVRPHLRSNASSPQPLMRPASVVHLMSHPLLFDYLAHLVLGVCMPGPGSISRD